MRTVVPLAIALAWPLPAGAAGFSTDRSRVAADASGVFDVDGGGVRDGLTWDAAH